jgi:hypothetical protein
VNASRSARKHGHLLSVSPPPSSRWRSRVEHVTRERRCNTRQGEAPLRAAGSESCLRRRRCRAGTAAAGTSAVLRENAIVDPFVGTGAIVHQGHQGERDAADELLERIELSRLDATRRLDPEGRSEMGQYLTPLVVARFMASMLTPRADRVEILDAGAGVGSLAAAAVEAACGWRARRSREDRSGLLQLLRI